MKKHLLLTVCAIAIFSFFGNAQDLTADYKTYPSPYYTTRSAQFGNSVSIDGDYAVIGAKNINRNKGGAYILHNNGTSWEQVAFLSPVKPIANSYFGCSVAIKGDYVVVGAYDYNGAAYKSGAVFVFEKPADGWSNMHETAILKNSYGNYNFLLGYSVDISRDGNTIIAGDPYYGCINVFEKGTGAWENMVQSTTLRPSIGSTGAPRVISISSDGTIVTAGGSNYSSTGLSSNGAAFVFVRPGATWSEGGNSINQKAILLASDKANSDNLGSDVDVSGDGNVIVAGAKGKKAAYIFKKPDGGWVDGTEVKKITPSDNACCFGSSVDISENTVAVGSTGANNGTYNTGAVYVFEKTSSEQWTEIVQKAKYTPSDGISNSYYSNGGIALSEDFVIAGMPIADNIEGAVYFNKKTEAGWTDGTEYYKAPACPYLSDYHGEAYYGYSVDISGDYGVIGAYGDNYNAGNVFVIHNTGSNWDTVAVLTASDAVGGYGSASKIGKTGAIYGDVIAAGGNGSIYIFEKPTGGWTDATETHKLEGTTLGYQSIDLYGNTLICDDGYNVDVFENTDGGSWTDVNSKTIVSIGQSITSMSISENEKIIAAGTPYINSSKGGVYVVDKTDSGDWGTVTKTLLSPSDAKANDYFGYSVKITNDILLAGAYYNNDNGTYAGKAYVFVRPKEGWSSVDFKQKLYPGDPLTNDYFGCSVDVYENRLIIGAFGKGRTYIFDREVNESWETDTITQTYKLNSSWGQSGQFGKSVSIGHSSLANEFLILIGEPDNDEQETNAGAAYIYHITDNSTFIRKEMSNADISIYPNPVQELLNIKGNSTVNSVSIMTITGQKAMEVINISGNGSINVYGLLPGMYIVKIKTGSGIVTKKIIKR